MSYDIPIGFEKAKRTLKQQKRLDRDEHEGCV